MALSLRALAVVLALAVPLLTPAATRCDRLLAAFGQRLADPVCIESPDLTTANPDTTPANNSIAGLPAGAFTPVTDRAVIAPDAAHKTPITRAVPGVELRAWIADDPLKQARFLLRLPDDWNGSLVVAGASGTRSEFNGDFAWSDYVVQKGYAYASQNKGVLNLFITTAADPLGCRLNEGSGAGIFVHFFDDDPGQEFTRWRDFMVEAGRLARRGVEARYGREPRYAYAVGTSNGGYQVRRAVESAPEVFDGGVDWEGTYVDARTQNLLTDLPAGVLNFTDYKAGGFLEGSTAAKNIRAAGYPPDIVVGNASLWGNYDGSFWEVTLCQWQKRLDPTYDTYGAGAGTSTYNYVARLSASEVGSELASFETTGRIRRPLVTVAGTMDALLPIDHHARAYARKVAAWRTALPAGDNGRLGAPEYRLWEIQNGNHIETYSLTFPQLELIEPHAQRAFDLLVQHVEHGAALPADQCVPHGGAVTAAPAQPGHCTALFVP